MVGRLKPGMSAAQAQSDAERVAQEIMRNYPPMMATLRISAVVRPLQEETVEQTRPLLRTLFLAVAVVLLIACVNLAGLMLVRAIRRQREIAVRLALGARAVALLRQAILESLVLSVGGGLLGLVLAALALRGGQEPAAGEPAARRRDRAQLAGGRICTAAGCRHRNALRIGAGLCRAAHQRERHAERRRPQRSAGGGHARLRSALVVAEIAIALVLLAASGLLLRSFEKMRSVDLGFRPDHVATASYSLPQKQYSTQAHQLMHSIANCCGGCGRLPGVDGVRH